MRARIPHSRSTRKVPTAIALLACIALIPSACGDSDDETRPTELQSTPATESEQAPQRTATAEATIDKADDRKIAADALLTLDDFPSGWTEADDDGAEPNYTCDAIEAAKDQVSARKASPSFSQSDAQAENAVYVFPDEDTARRAYAAISSKATRTCIADGLAEYLDDRDGIEVGDVDTGRLAVDPLGDEREAARIVVPLTAEGVDADFTADVVYVRVGRAVALNVFGDAFTTFDDDQREDLTGKVARRLSAGVS